MNPLKTVASHFFPSIMILAIFFVLVHYSAQVPKLFWSMTSLLFYISSVIAIGVSWHYNRSRFVFILLPVITLFLAMTTWSQVQTRLLVELVPLIIPLHLILFLFLKERGLFSLWGGLKTFFVIIEIAVVYYVIDDAPEILTYLHVELFQAHMTDWTPLGDLALLTSVVFFFLFLLFSFLHFQIIYHTAFTGMFLLLMIGIHFYDQEFYMALAFFGVTLTIFGILLKESYRLAFYDELTALPGRRALMEDMAKLGRKYSLAMVDIDHFKKFNDSYGHDTGDDVLKMVASILSNIEGGGKAYRYGGEEFTVLFSSKSVDEALRSMDRLRQDIEFAPFTVRNGKNKKKILKPRKVSINISGGVVEKEGKDKDPLAVMKRADNALYKAKRSGRNKVVKG